MVPSSKVALLQPNDFLIIIALSLPVLNLTQHHTNTLYRCPIYLSTPYITFVMVTEAVWLKNNKRGLMSVIECKNLVL